MLTSRTFKDYVRSVLALVLVTAVLCCVACAAAESKPKPKAPRERKKAGVGLTIYNTQMNAYNTYNYYNPYWRYGYNYRQRQPVRGWAVVKDWRRLKLRKGTHSLRFADVAKLIESSTVNFKSLLDPEGTTVLEQNYEFDLVNANRLLEKYIDKEITVETATGNIVGRLLSFDAGQLVINTGGARNPIQIVSRGQNVRQIRFPKLPGGLITKPTLVWMVDAEKSGEHLVKVTYQTRGISWLSDYNVVINPNDTRVDVSGWVTINNQSGASYRKAELKLMAGDVHRAVGPGIGGNFGSLRDTGKAGRAGSAPGFKQKSFFEFHLYTLGRPTTIPDRSMKQIELFNPCRGVPARKVLAYDGAKGSYWGGSSLCYQKNYGVHTGNKKVSVYIEFANRKKLGMGIPLPAGRVRVYKTDPDDGSLEFIGEDRIDHTPKDELVRLKLGECFDVVGERKQVKFEVDHGRAWVRETYDIEIRNHKDTDIEVLVIEHMYRWSNWILEKISDPYLKKDSRTVHVPVKIKANSKKQVRYTVFYSAYPIKDEGVLPRNHKELKKSEKAEKD